MFEGGYRNVRIDDSQAGQEAIVQDHLVVVGTLRAGTIGGDVVTTDIVISDGSKPFEAELFQLIFSYQFAIALWNFEKA